MKTQDIKNSPKLSFSVVLSIITTLFTVLQSNAELLGVSTKTIAIISLVITTASLVYDKYFDSEQSIFSKGAEAYRTYKKK